MGFFRSPLYWFFSLFLFSRTSTGETCKQENGSNPQIDLQQLPFPKRGKYPIHLENGIFNEWYSFRDWTCNAPQVKLFVVSDFTQMEGGHMLHRIILFGGQTARQSKWSRTTWIYYDEVNCWHSVDGSSSRPPALQPLSLTTVCNEYAILLLGLHNNSIWTFGINSKEWEEISVSAETIAAIKFVDLTISKGVGVQDAHSSCHCREAVLFVSCHFEVSPLHQLRCRNNSGRISYRWSTVDVKYPKEFQNTAYINCQSVVSSASTEIVFAAVENCIWYYEVSRKTWHSTASCFTEQFDDEMKYVSTALPDIDQNLTIHLSLSAGHVDQEVIRWNASSLQGTFERILGSGPPPASIISTRALSSVEFLAYVNEDYISCSFSTWILKRDNISAVWYWTRSLIISISFPYLSNHAISSIRNNNIYILSERKRLSHNFKIQYYELSALDLNLMRWEIIQLFKDKTKLLQTEELQASAWLGDRWLIVSGRHTTVVEPGKQLRVIKNPMGYSDFFTVVAINESSAVLFGGAKLHRSLNGIGVQVSAYVTNDLWHFSSKTFEWKEIILTYSGQLIPPPRRGHAAAAIDSDMFIFGGIGDTGQCLADLWKFNSHEGTWSIVKAENCGPRLSGVMYCDTNAVASAGQLWIAIKYEYYSDIICEDTGFEIWIFIIDLAIWEPLIVYDDNLLVQSLPLIRLGFWSGYLINYANVPRSLAYMTVGCPAGYASVNLSKIACDICEVGFYSDVGSKNCISCPRGTTTKTTRSRNITFCTICVPGYCDHGRCLVVTDDSAPSPYCQCRIGFTGSRCQYATYFYISLGVIMFVVSLVIIWYIRRKKKINEVLLSQQIRQLKEVWQIGWGEITVQEEIGGGASGRVLLARYRDTFVAVKMLKDDDPQDVFKFTEEIKFMQTMRHPNIVLFLGAGKTPEERPFLVLEFIRRGSLRKVLDDESTLLSTRRKIHFATDAAKGMAFLHNLNPPRIHRDLKGENLLVSESWIVMVADFGLGRCFKSEQPRQRKRHRPITEPLLEEEHLSLDGIGTARWSAPELSRREKYDGSIDVYR
jgi:hypothetical protein